VHRIEQRTVAGYDALVRLAELRADFRASGLYPVLLGEPSEARSVLAALDPALSPAAVLAEVESIDPAQRLRQRDEAYQAEIEDELGEWAEDDSEPDDIEGEWPDEPQGQASISAHLHLSTGKPKREVVIALLTIQEPWQAFAPLDWGGWNECPYAAEHCAVHRYWAAKYGSEVVSITSDVVECSVARPPMDRETAMRLAWEQFFYCPDIVEQGTQTVAALAAALLASSAWFFWWD
jgi:hypothetical protein